MPSRARIQTVKADFLESSLYDDAGLGGLPRLSRGTLLATLSRAFDLAEGRRPGHAQRVAYVGVFLARELELPPAQVEEVFFGCLLHDAGMAPGHPGPRIETGRGTSIITDRANAQEILAGVRASGWAEVIAALSQHCETGALVARKLGFSEAVVRAVASHHDCWDGSGPSITLDEDPPPMVSRVVSVADRVESMIDTDASPLMVRRQGPQLVREMAGSEIDPLIAEKMAAVAGRDDFWLGFYDNDMAGSLIDPNYGGAMSADDLFDVAGVISDLVDSRNGRPPGRGRRVADMARDLAVACDMSPRRADLVKLAAMLQDIGTLGVPPHFLSKPDILTIEEMDVVQLHPVYARDILSEVPGLGAIAWWIGCHHERVDGKGYPGMLEGDEVPPEAQIVGIVDAYDALTSDRPYRAAISPADAVDVIRGLTGTRFGPWVVESFEALVDTFID